MKKPFIRLLPVLLSIAVLLILLALYPQAGMQSAAQALDAFLTVVFPSLFPFCAGALLLLDTGVLRLLGALLARPVRILFGMPGDFAYVFLASALSGYPMGVRLTAELYAQDILDEREAACMLNGTSTSGPLFMSAAVAAGMMGAPALAWYILLPHYAAALLVAFINGLFCRKRPSRAGHCTLSAQARAFIGHNPMASRSLGDVLASAVSRAMDSMLLICGFMMLFTVLVSVLEQAGLFHALSAHGDFFAAIVAGLFEMTGGCLRAASLTLEARLCLVSFFIGFGGFSILAQSYALCARAHLKPRGFLPSKLAQGVLSAALCSVLLRLAPPQIPAGAFHAADNQAACWMGPLFFVFSCIVCVLICRFVAKARFLSQK